MKNIIVLALAIFAISSCGNHSGNSQQVTHSEVSDTGSMETRPNPGSNATSDTTTTTTTGNGTDKIPSRTGATGQGNTSVTGSATGSPTGAAKDSIK